MTPEELESILQGQEETQRIEFKRSVPWNENWLAKDILAMSNVQDGGYIIIGVDDPFNRLGVSQEIIETYKVDDMKDQMTKFADPHVDFSVVVQHDAGGLNYVVIYVRPFEEIPVICRKDSGETKAGTLYYRNKNRRVESAHVSNSYDMRNIIETATIKMMQRKEWQGYSVNQTTRISRLEEELDGL